MARHGCMAWPFPVLLTPCGPPPPPKILNRTEPTSDRGLRNKTATNFAAQWTAQRESASGNVPTAEK
eukprot:1775677-Lingulodinium_polyedra.AAC.1